MRLTGYFLKFYLVIHEWIHDRAMHWLAISHFNGLHPKNVFHYRSEFFEEHVGADDLVLDVACGTGRILASLSQIIKAGLGIDWSDKNLNECRKHHQSKNLKFSKLDILNADYNSLKNDFSYTKAVYSHILEHVEDVPALLRKVSAPQILICVPSQENWYRQMLKHTGLNYLTDPTHFREYTREMLVEELTSSGYVVKSIGFNSEGEIICWAVLQ